MKDRILNCLSVLLVAAVWVAFILFIMFLASCNSSKHLQTTSTVQDSTVKMGKDSTAVSTSREESREMNEKITRMIFGLQESVDAKGDPVTNIYPKEYVTIDRGSKEQIAEKKDSVHLVDTTATALSKRLDELDKASKTQVFPMWWLWAIGAGGLAFGFVTRYFNISKR